MSTFTAESPMPMRRPLSERINIRLIAFLTILGALPVAVLAGFIFYNGGITHTAEGDMIDLKALGNFTFDPNNGTTKDVPPKWRAYDGKRVVLEGFMFNRSSAASYPKDFEFVYNIQQCCFNGPPLVQERVYVHVPEGRNVKFYGGDLSRVVGILHVSVEKSKDGTITSVFSMDVEKAWKPGFLGLW